MPETRVTAGDRKHEITIQAPIGVLDESAAVTVEEGVRMAITVLPLPFQQREQLRIGGVGSQTLYTVTCTYRTDVQPSYVLLEQCCTQRTFQIVAIIPSDRRDVLAMTCVTNG